MKTLKDSLVIFKVLLNEVLNNVFSNSIFAKKQNKYIFAIIFVTLYILYYILNIFSIKNIKTPQSQLSNEIINTTISSLFNNIVIVSGVIYLMVEMTFSITNKMKCQLKILPFEKNSFLLAIKIFKAILGLAIFSLVFMLIVPMFKLLYLPVNLLVTMMVLCNLIFLVAFQLYYLVFSSLLVKVDFIKKYKLNFGLLIVLLFYYFFKYRFIIDSWVGSSEIVFTMTLGIYLIMISIFMLIALTIINYQIDGQDDIVYSKNNFITIYSFKSIDIFKFYFLGFIRNKLTISLIGVCLLLSLICLYDTGNILLSLETGMYIYPCIAITGIRYYDTSLQYRKMNHFFGISEIREVLTITLINLIINLPLIIISFWYVDYFEMMLNSIIWFECATVSGILFPKNKSSLNEFASAMVCLVLMVLTYLAAKNIVFFIITFVGMFFLKKYLLERGRKYEIF